MTQHNITKGMTVYLVKCCYRREHDASPFVEAEVVKVGRKYFKVALFGKYRHEYQFCIEDLRQKTNDSADYYVHLDKQELLDKREKDKLTGKIRGIFDYRTNHNLTLEQLRQIDAIIETQKRILESEVNQ